MIEEIPRSELCDRYADLYSGVLTDVLDDRGLPEQTIRADLDPLDPSLRMAGLAFTAVGRRNAGVDPDEQIREHLRMVGEAPADAVLVLECNDGASAQVGELMTTALASQGARGCVLDGGTRDSRQVLDQGFPVFTRYRTPEDSVPRWELLDWDVEVTLGGVAVSPGDVVFGDLDGVVVVPRDHAVPVLREAESRANEEDRVREAIRSGESPLDAYEEYGVF